MKEKFGKILHLKAEDIEKSETWFQKKSDTAVLFCRCVPIVRSLISIPAGMSKMNFTKFILLTTMGTVIWNVVITTLGRIAGNSWELISDGMSEYSHIVYIIMLLIICILILRKFLKKKNIFLRRKGEQIRKS